MSHFSFPCHVLMNSKRKLAWPRVEGTDYATIGMERSCCVWKMKPRADVPVISCHSVAALLSPSQINQVAVNRNYPHFQGTFHLSTCDGTSNRSINVLHLLKTLIARLFQNGAWCLNTDNWENMPVM